MAYIGNVPAEKYSALTQQTFSSPTGTSFTLDQSCTNSRDIALFIDNVRQNPASYTVSGTSLTTSTISSPSTMYCLFNGRTTETVNPPDDSVGTAKVSDNAITLAKMAGGTDGQVITYDASGDPVAVGPGTDGQVLTSTGAGSPPAFEDAGGGGAWTLIGTAVASDSASLTITGLDTSVYETFAIRCSNIVPASDGQGMYFRLGDSGGIDSGASDYGWVQIKQHTNTLGPSVAGGASASSILIDGYTGNASGENFSISATLSAPASGLAPHIHYDMTSYVDDHTIINHLRGASARKAVMNVTQIQCFMGSGNITSGRMTVWGIAHA